MHTLTVKLKGCMAAAQRNGGKHVTFDPLVRVTARPAETSERRNIMKMIRSDSPLPPQTGSQVDNCSKLPTTVRPTLSPAFKRTRLESFTAAIKGSDSTLKEKKVAMSGFV